MGLMIKSMCVFLGGHMSKSRGVVAEGVPCPTNKGVSYTKLVFGLAVTLKVDY